MKKILIIFLFLFNLQSLSRADDISEFEIEGMSIGDSLLDFFSEENLANFTSNFYPSSKKYKKMAITDDKFQNYDFVQVEYLTNDKKYIIQSISGIIWGINIEKCLIKKKEIENEISSVLSETKKINYKKSKHSESFPNSYNYETAFQFLNTDKLRLYCIDWSEEVEKEKNYKDHLSVDFSKREFMNWLNTEAFK